MGRTPNLEIWLIAFVPDVTKNAATQDKHSIQSKRDIRTPGQILPIEVTSKARLSGVVGRRRHIGETEARGRTDRGVVLREAITVLRLLLHETEVFGHIF